MRKTKRQKRKLEMKIELGVVMLVVLIWILIHNTNILLKETRFDVGVLRDDHKSVVHEIKENQKVLHEIRGDIKTLLKIARQPSAYQNDVKIESKE
jgi:hypothetical protein